MKRLAALLSLCLGCVAACDGGAADPATDTTAAADVADDAAASSCPLSEHTTPTTTVSASGCVLLDRDTSACRAGREALGLSGFWLSLSCRVTVTRATAGGVEVVRAEADGQPDHESFYFPTDSACYRAYPEGQRNPNEIVATTRAIDFPVTPVAAGGQVMGGGIVGIAINGVPIFGNTAAPGDDIFLEFSVFDRCGAHPQQTGTYHYHGEPLAISNDDARLIGVLRDGYPVYGRRDHDGSLPTDLDADGGHVSVTAHSAAAAVYHYHLSEQESSGQLTAGQRQWLLTTGTYHGAPAACAACR